ncbi:DUF5819 family protein [Streptomyces aureus]
MDARNEGSKREPGSVAPEGAGTGAATGGALGATDGPPLPGPRPADEAVTGGPPSADAPSADAQPGGPRTGAPRPSAPRTGAPPAADEASEPAGADEPESTVPEASAGLADPVPTTAAALDLAPNPDPYPDSGPRPAQDPGSGPQPSSDPGPAPEPAPAPLPEPGTGAPAGLAALPLRYQLAAAFALALVAVVACVHLGMVFLHVAPSNTVTKQHGRAIDDWIYPEFEQNWKLFAPNPLQQDIAVQVRAEVRLADGTSRETGWYDLSALDGRAIDRNPLPSHTQQNELRRAWDFYLGTHDGENRPVGLRGDLSESYLRRIGVLRLDREHAGGEGAHVERVQFRSLTTDVPPPRWSDEKVSDRPVVRELPWWAVPAGERGDGPTEASAR